MTRKRLGPHDDRFHEYRVTPRGLHIGGPLTQLRGILGGEADRGRNPARSPREPAGGVERWVRTVHARWSCSTWVGRATGSWSAACSTRRVSIPGRRPQSPELRRLLAEGRLDLVLADTKGGRGPLMTCCRRSTPVPEAGDLPMVLLAEADEVPELADLVIRRPNAVLLAKPVDPGQLRAAVEAGLRYWAGRRRERELVRQLTEANASLRRPTGARTSSWPRWPTSCATPWPRSATALQILKRRAGDDPGRRAGAGR